MNNSSQILFSDLNLKGNSNIFTYEKSYQQLEEEYQKQIKKNNKDNSLIILKNNLTKCGRFADRYWYCKKCRADGNEALLRIDRKVIRDCQNKFCSNSHCISTRFARTFNRLKDAALKELGPDGKPIEIKPLDSKGKPFSFPGMKKKYKSYPLSNYPKLFHFSIGFPHIDLTNENLKNQKRVINSYFSKVKKSGIKINAIQTMDISMGDRHKEKDGKFFVHYHFMAVPFEVNKVRSTWIQMHEINKKMVSKQRVKFPFNIKFHTTGGKYKDRESMLSYLAIRSIGLFKPHEDKEENKTMSPKKLIKSVEDGKYMFFSDFMNVEDYFKLFHKRHMLTVIGDRLVIPESSTILDNIVGAYPDFCKCCGHLKRKDVCFEEKDCIVVETPPDPPETLVFTYEHIKPSSPVVSENRIKLLNKMKELGIKVPGVNC